MDDRQQHSESSTVQIGRSPPAFRVPVDRLKEATPIASVHRGSTNDRSKTLSTPSMRSCGLQAPPSANSPISVNLSKSAAGDDMQRRKITKEITDATLKSQSSLYSNNLFDADTGSTGRSSRPTPSPIVSANTFADILSDKSEIPEDNSRRYRYDTIGDNAMGFHQAPLIPKNCCQGHPSYKIKK